MIFFVFLLGACVGSFIFAFYERFCEKKPILSARSHCFFCEKKLKFYHLIPIFSYIFLRGKCGFCGAKITPLSPFCEFFCGLLFVFAFLLTLNPEFIAFSGYFSPLNNDNLNANFLNLLNALNTDFIGTLSAINAQKFTLDFVFLAFYLSTLLLLSLIDSKLKAVPETLLWASFIFAFCFAINLRDIYGFLFWGGIDGFVLYAPLFAGFVFLLKSLVSCVLNLKKQRDKLESMGEADILIIASMGGILGFANGFVMIFLACILAFFAFLILKIKEKFTPFFAKNSAKNSTQNKENFTPNFVENSQNFTPNSPQNKAQNFSENSVLFKQKNDSDFKQNAKFHANFTPNELPFIPFLSAAFLIIFALKDIL